MPSLLSTLRCADANLALAQGPGVPGMHRHVTFQMGDLSLLCLGLPNFQLSVPVPASLRLPLCLDSTQGSTNSSLWVPSGGSTIDPPVSPPRNEPIVPARLSSARLTKQSLLTPFPLFQTIPVTGTVYIHRRHTHTWLDIQLQPGPSPV